MSIIIAIIHLAASGSTAKEPSGPVMPVPSPMLLMAVSEANIASSTGSPSAVRMMPPATNIIK